MSQIFDKTFERMLDALVAKAEPGQSFEAWTFDDAKSRRETEERLKKKGICARIRSAYKPLLFTFLEEINLDGVDAIEVRYPVHENAPANRFRLEAYPLAALVGDAKLDFIAREDDSFHYEVTLSRRGKTETLKVLAPNRVHTDIVGETNVSPTGWFRLAGDASGERLETDYEQLFEAAISAVANHGWGDEEPYFEELNIRVTHPAEDLPLSVGDEVVSLREALHEDFYFSLLEFFQKNPAARWVTVASSPARSYRKSSKAKARSPFTSRRARSQPPSSMAASNRSMRRANRLRQASSQGCLRESAARHSRRAPAPAASFPPVMSPAAMPR